MTGRPDKWAMNAVRDFGWSTAVILFFAVLVIIVIPHSTTKTVHQDMICIMPEKEK